MRQMRGDLFKAILFGLGSEICPSVRCLACYAACTHTTTVRVVLLSVIIVVSALRAVRCTTVLEALDLVCLVVESNPVLCEVSSKVETYCRVHF